MLTFGYYPGRAVLIGPPRTLHTHLYTQAAPLNTRLSLCGQDRRHPRHQQYLLLFNKNNSRHQCVHKHINAWCLVLQQAFPMFSKRRNNRRHIMQSP